MMKSKLFILCFLAVCQVCQANFLPVNLKVNGLPNPVGIDTSNPTFSWQTESDERGFLQSAYELVVRSASGAEVWKSGKVESALQNQITYAGSPLVSCSPYSWTVTVYDNNGKASVASEGTFETAFLNANEWKAQWIQPAKTCNAKVEIPLQTSCRYVKLDVTKLGLPASTDSKFYFLQLAEMEIYSGEENVARKATFSASDTWTIGNWNLNYLNDGVVQGTTLGYTTTQKNNNSHPNFSR
jgi:alpha-L-rhamnosidase